MSWRRWILPVVAVLATAVAVVLTLVAVDVLRVNDAMKADDVRFHARPTLSGLWEESGSLPGDLSRRIIGIEDDVRYRRAVWLVRRVRPGSRNPVGPELEGLAASAESKLIEASRRESDPRRRSKLLNLLGLVALNRYAGDPTDRVNIIRTAIDSFQSAIKADPENAEAKFNLELVLRDFFIAEAAGANPDRGRLGGRTAGLGRDGSGY